MGPLYLLHSSADIKVMQDGSGIALHSGLSGRFAFLKNQQKHLVQSTTSNILSGKFSEQDLKQLLYIDHEQAGKLALWLVDNKFISKC
jgi:hypothetical protein